MTDLHAAAERALQGNLHKEAEKLARQNKLFVRDRLARLLDEGSFVEDGLLESDRKGADLVARVTLINGADGRAVDAARKEGADRHIGHRLAPDCIPQSPVKLLDRLAFGGDRLGKTLSDHVAV